MYSNTPFDGCCGARIISNVTGITSQELKGLNKNPHTGGYSSYTLYAIVQVGRQAAALKKFYAAGWVNSGRKWKARSGNTLQTIVRYPIKRK